MQIIHISGFLSRDPELAQTQGGDDICRLNVPVKQGWGDKEQTNWYRVSVWGKRAKSLASNLRKGVKVNVVGELTIGEYQGKAQYDIRAVDVDFPPQGEARSNRSEDRPGEFAEHRGGGAPQFDVGLDDNVPFLTCAMIDNVKRRVI